MRILQIELNNIGTIPHAVIPLDQTLTVLFGKPKAGKTTALNGINLACGGKFPDDIIRHGATEAFVHITTDSGHIRREFYLTEQGIAKARKVDFVRDGVTESNPFEELKGMINPFLANPDHLNRMTDRQRNDFFVEILGVDVRELNAHINEMEKAASALRAKIKTYGEIDLTPVDEVDEESLKAERSLRLEVYSVTLGQVKEANEVKRRANEKHGEASRRMADHRKTIERLQAELAKAEELAQLGEAWLEKHQIVALDDEPERPDTSDLDELISEARATTVKRAIYLQNVARSCDRDDDKDKLKLIEQSTREAYADFKETLATASDNCPIAGLGFNAAGDVVYEDTSAEMLSTSQRMRLRSDIRGLYTGGLEIELVDQGESLGEDIYTLIEHAQECGLTVLASVVGETPTDVPAHVGVFIVENGEIDRVETQARAA